jgi:hypothetical protein
MIEEAAVALPMQKEGMTFVGMRPDDFRPLANDVAPAPEPILARPNPTVDWNALMAETEIEWRMTLDYLGR